MTIYSCVDSLCNLLHTSYRHDHNLSLWHKVNQEIRLIHHWELERTTGLKHHDVAFFSVEDAENFINGLLSVYGLSLSDMNAVWGTPLLDTLTGYNVLEPYGAFTYHALCHLFSSLLIDSRIFYEDEILALSYDSGSDVLLEENARERAMYLYAYSRRGEILKMSPIFSPAIYWSTSKVKFGLEEGTLMALAYASKSRSLENAELMQNLKDAYGDKDRLQVSKQLDELEERIASYGVSDQGKLFNYYDERFSIRENQISMIMKIVQEFTIQEVDRLLSSILHKHKIDPERCYLSLSGGYGLNCPTNSYLIRKYRFKGLVVPPCINDGGQAIGMGLLYFYTKLPRFSFKLKNAYYGNREGFSPQNLMESAFAANVEDINYGLDKLCEDLMKGPVVWLEDRAEIGPRALGHRSILADPRKLESKCRINAVKQRQWWRPVAPVIMEDYVEEWFENGARSPFMLNNFLVKSSRQKAIPAVLHLDDTARVQTVSKEDGLIYRALQLFYQRTGVPILCNTSLNDKGEPIIDSITQAVTFALRKGITILYVNGWRISLHNTSGVADSGPAQRDDKLFTCYAGNSQLVQKNNPYHITAQEFFFAYMNCDPMFDFTNAAQVEYMRKLRRMYHRLIPEYETVFEKY